MVGKDDLEVQLSLKLSRAFLPQDALSLLQGRKFILESNHRTLDSETEIS